METITQEQNDRNSKLSKLELMISSSETSIQVNRENIVNMRIILDALRKEYEVTLAEKDAAGEGGEEV